MQRLLGKRIHRALLAALCLVAGAAHGQLNVEVSASTAGAQLPVATAMFANEASLPQVVSAVIRDDLVRSGRVRNVDFGTAPIAETQAPDYGGWNGRGAAAVVTGSVTPEAGGRYTVRFKLYDVTKRTSLGGMAYSVTAPQLRLTAHRIADYVYEKLFGDRGVFATRLSFVTRAGNGYKLVIADSDGYNPITALSSAEPIISPAWSPDGKNVAYVSFESRKPVVYLHQLATGRRIVLANERGNNSAPSWSPDGRQLVLALSRDGNTQVYLINADGTGLKRLSASDGIDTEPQFSPDGRTIYFTSDRGGAPQIYRMSVDGERAGGAQRVTFKGGFNVSPRISPDGRYLAFISRGGGGYKLHLQDLTSGEVTPLTDTGYDETPSFAANGKFVIYATRVNGRRVLAAVSTDGLTRQILEVSGGSVGEPAWGPFMQ